MSRRQTKIDARIISELKLALDTAKHGEKEPIIAKYAGIIGLSIPQLRRYLRSEFGRSRKPRTDMGKTRVNKAAYEVVAKIVLRAIDDEQGRRLATSEAIKIAEDQKLIPSGALSVTTFNRLAKDDQAIKKARETVRWQADYPNQVWQIDTSGSEYLEALYYDRSNSDYMIGVRKPGAELKPYKNKPNDPMRNRLWITAIVDDYSRVAFARYWVAPGENAPDVLEVTKAAMLAKGDHILQGKPEVLISDAGPFKHKLGESFCESMGIVLRGGTPGEHGFTAKVERFFNFYWRREIKQLLEPDMVQPLSVINDWLMGELAAMNAMQHPELGMLRTQRWQEINFRGGVVQVTAEDLENTSFKWEIRTVRDNLTFSLKNRRYKVPREVPIGARVRVMTSGDTGEVSVEVLGTGMIFQAQLYGGPHAYDTFKGVPNGKKEELIEAAEELEVKVPTHEPDASVKPLVRQGEKVKPKKVFKEKPGYFESWSEAESHIVDILQRPISSLDTNSIDGLKRMIENGFTIRDIDEVVRKVKKVLDQQDASGWKKVN